ncbi:MAG: NAD(P)/FAD-dependent oxidoreductase [Bacteroidetes bacterium]|nr:NAD(P)/FAD-dependent oxidoreductase [Bacteroidota bacterium]
MQHFDIAIIGAGPAGATCALALRDAGLRVALIDKSSFPRDKVCGDAIPARAVRVLREIAPEVAQQFAEFPPKTTIRACSVVAPNGQQFTYHFAIPGYCARRIDFDAFLVNAATANPELQFFPGQAVENITREGQIWRIQTTAQVLSAKLIIGCDGANGVTSKQLGAFELDPNHHCAAVRAYFQGVADLQPDTMEIHLVKDGLPGYFWIFPVNAHECNVGFGMLSKHIAERKIALRPALTEIISKTPALAKRFEGAKMQGKVLGFGLPLGSRWMTNSGDGFLLCGDAASLIDPATGEGIGNAMWSAQMAAKHAIKAFQSQNFSAAALSEYSKELHSKLAKELRQKYWAQKLIADRPWLLNWLIGRAGKNGIIAWLVKKVF